MKKRLLALTSLPFLLSSCGLRIRWQGPATTVHWQDVTHVVPWYVVWVPAILFTVLVLAACVRYYTGRQYRCPVCGQVFRPRRWEISVLLHQNAEAVVRCPRCGRKGFCPPAEDGER